MELKKCPEFWRRFSFLVNISLLSEEPRTKKVHPTGDICLRYLIQAASVQALLLRRIASKHFAWKLSFAYSAYCWTCRNSIGTEGDTLWSSLTTFGNWQTMRGHINISDVCAFIQVNWLFENMTPQFILCKHGHYCHFTQDARGHGQLGMSDRL